MLFGMIDLNPTLCYKAGNQDCYSSLPMIDVSKGAAGDTKLADDARWALVQRIVSSRGFAKASQLREILLYLSRRALEDDPKAIREDEVGRHALGRRADFNPHEDNIVRVQVRHLRQKLADYFNAEGQNERLILLIPKGTYVPQFADRPPYPPQPATEHNEPAGSGSLAPLARYPGTDSDSAKPAYPWLLIAFLSVLLAVLGVMSLVLWRQRENLRRASAPIHNPLVPNEDLLWSRMFSSDQETSIVLADNSLVTIQGIMGVEAPLDDYSGGAYADRMIDSIRERSMQRALRSIAIAQSTSLADVSTTVRLMEVCRRYNGQCRIRYSRYLDPREFKTGNFILLGSRQSNPWDGLFEPQLNFYLDHDTKTHRYRMGNRSPLPGEQTYYASSPSPPPGEQAQYGSFPDDKGVEESYAYLALMPNLSGTGYVLIVSGINMADTEAAGELVSSPGFSATLLRILSSKGGKPSAPYVELLLQSTVTSGTARVSKIVAYRLITPQKSVPP